MKDISIYFSSLPNAGDFSDLKLGGKIIRHEEGGFPEISSKGIAIFHVPEYRGSKSFTQELKEQQFREYLYNLNLGIGWTLPIYDLGDILPGAELNDTYYAVSNVVTELVKQNVIPVLIGGTQDLTLAMYKGYEGLEQMVNLCAVDYALDLGEPEDEVHAEGYLSHLLLQRPSYLFNHANIGLQAPFASKAEFDLFEKLYFDVCRLGEFNADFKRAEPHLRNSDILSFDLKSIRASELNSDQYLQPNGFYADQICQISKYAGISDKMTSLGLFNYYPESEQGTLSALVAQIVWYFIDGISLRKGDFPIGSKKNYTKFVVPMDDFKETLVFYKSDKSDRWWMEVSYPETMGSKYERHHMVPCNKEDYDLAMKNEVPDLWWKTYQKFV
jgi:formiminoglutamase